MTWQVYIILCTDETLYTGITVDVNRRFKEHGGGLGAKYFRGRQPKQLIYVETGHDRSSASKREIVIKKMPRLKKLQLLAADINNVKNCANSPCADSQSTAWESGSRNSSFATRG